VASAAASGAVVVGCAGGGGIGSSMVAGVGEPVALIGAASPEAVCGSVSAVLL
jgi:hypothetical protein